jgi:solute carrier family 13 (sodium-dependent dicarboxylate transporter), member 2/3/5
LIGQFELVNETTMTTKRLKPVELEIELFCRGLRIENEVQGARRISRTRAGLGSGLEIVIPARPKKIWVNVPVVEPFTKSSPFALHWFDDHCFIVDERTTYEYRIEIPEEPAWYSRTTAEGIPMHRIGVLQGNYLGIYVATRCAYWNLSNACKFCTTGKNVGAAEEWRKSVEDVVAVAKAARDESGVIFTHLNTGYHFEDQGERESMHGLRQCEPFVRALREQVGGFIGVQAVPVPRERFHEYDALIAAGVDHFSFCYEFEDPAVFAELCPGKATTVGQHAFFEAMEYTAARLGRGRVSGEIIAGVEPIEATKRGIDRIVAAGAFPTVCIFRPTIGSDMESYPAPDPEEMKEVFAHLHESCRRAGLPVGILPIEVSLVVQPEETAALVAPNLASTLYAMKNRTLRQLAKPYIAWKKRPRVA